MAPETSAEGVRENRVIPVIEELLDEIQPEKIDPGLYDALAALTVDSIWREDGETLSYVWNQTSSRAFQLEDGAAHDEIKGRLLSLCAMASWALTRAIPEVSQEESTWLQLAYVGYPKVIHNDNDNSRHIGWTPEERSMLASHMIIQTRRGKDAFVRVSPKGEERLRRDGYVRE